MIFVFWGAVERRWPEMAAGLAPEFEVETTRDITFGSDVAFLSMMFDLYMGPFKPLALVREHREKSYLPVITAKAKAIGSRRVRVLTTRHVGDGDAGKAADRVKKRIRRSLPAATEKPQRINMHASDGPAEMAYIADILLNETNIRHVHLRRAAPPRPAFMDRLGALRDWCAAQKIDPRTVCVVSGGVLEACDIRASNDLDIVMASDQRARFGPEGRKDIAPGVDLAAAGYHRSIGDDEIIGRPERHFTLMGVRFAALPIVAEMKTRCARVKDSRDRTLLTRPDIAALVDSLRCT